MIQAERTPNPNSLKFTAASGRFSGGDIFAITSADEADRHPLGESLFAIEGVVDVFITPEFVTVSKAETTEWTTLKGRIEDTLTDYLQAS
jgi:hypothetical protein